MTARPAQVTSSRVNLNSWISTSVTERKGALSPVAVESCCSSQPPLLLRGMVSVAVGHVHTALLCLLLSHCAQVRLFQPCRGPGSAPCWRTARSAHTGQTNWTNVRGHSAGCLERVRPETPLPVSFSGNSSSQKSNDFEATVSKQT